MSFDFGGGSKSSGSKKSFMSTSPKATAPDPLASVEYTDDLQADAASELSALAVAFKERRGVEDKRFQQATDSEFWAALCFRSREQKDAFIAAAGATRLGDKYIDGVAFAKLLGIDLPD